MCHLTYGAVTLQPATNRNQLYASFLFWINNWRQGHSHHKWALVTPTAKPAGHLRGPSCTIAHVQYPVPMMQGNVGAGHLWMKTTPRDMQYIAKKMETVLFSIKTWIYFIITETFLCNSCNSGCFRNACEIHAAVIHSHCRKAKAMFTSTKHCSTCHNFRCEPVEPEPPQPESPETFSSTSCSSSHTGSLSVVLILAFNSASQFFTFRLCNPLSLRHQI